MANPLYGYLLDAGRTAHVDGLTPQFAASLNALYSAAPPNIRSQMRILSGFRSVDRQRELFDAAVKKYGSPQKARKWVAPPGNSKHNHGSAVDLRYLDPAASAWVHENAQAHGLAFPMSHEPWHIEPIGARSGHGGGEKPVAIASAQPQPMAGAPDAATVQLPDVNNTAAPVATAPVNAAAMIPLPVAPRSPFADVFEAFARDLAQQQPVAPAIGGGRPRRSIISPDQDPFFLG